MFSSSREQRSLFGEILDWMLAPLLLLWPMSVSITYLVAQGIAHRPYDRDLGEMARTLARRVVVESEAGRAVLAPERIAETLGDTLRADDTGQFYFQVLGTHGELVAGDRELPPPTGEPAPAGELRFRDDQLLDEPVRVASVRLALPVGPDEEPPLVQVAETLDRRSRLATEIIKGVILPQFVILPVAVLLVWLALARGLAPLNDLQRRIRQRESQDLSPIDERDAPEEVTPLVRAINDLLERLDTSMKAQKHFLADAAHQLKTPLAGLRMQAELAQREIDAGSDTQAVKRSLQQIALSSQRAAHMVNQLLSMARAEDEEQGRRVQSFDLARLATEAVHDLVPKAMDKRIDLGYEGPEEGEALPPLSGQPVLVGELVRNLVDNALQYTPPGGTVTVRVRMDPSAEAGQPVLLLQVEDSGPGIAPAERELVFQPFYRALGTNVDGSGLGLAIVREIAQRHNAEITLEDTYDRATHALPGTRVSVRFRLPPQEAADEAGDALAPQASPMLPPQPRTGLE
jgi:two-component system sensor histidine kinase TctE